MGFWLKSFNKEPYPVPGTHFTIPQINYRESFQVRQCLPSLTLA